MAVRRESVRPPRRPPAKPRGSGGLGKALAALWRAASPHWPWLVAGTLVGSGGVLGLALVVREGTVATRLHDRQVELLGWTAPLLALWLTALGVAVLCCHLRPDSRLPWWRGLGAALVSAALVGLGGIASTFWPDAPGGGEAGLALVQPVVEAFGPLGTGALLGAALLLGVAVLLQVPPALLLEGL